MAVFKKFESYRQESQPATPVPGYPQSSVIGKTLVIKGKLRGSEEIIIEGRVEGDINVKHCVIVGKSGIIKADIEANEVVIKGKVDGNVKAFSKVEIFPEGTLNGNIISQRVVLAEGAVFKGNIDMSSRDEKKPVPESMIDRENKEKKDGTRK